MGQTQPGPTTAGQPHLQQQHTPVLYILYFAGLRGFKTFTLFFRPRSRDLGSIFEQGKSASSVIFDGFWTVSKRSKSRLAPFRLINFRPAGRLGNFLCSKPLRISSIKHWDKVDASSLHEKLCAGETNTPPHSFLASQGWNGSTQANCSRRKHGHSSTAFSFPRCVGVLDAYNVRISTR